MKLSIVDVKCADAEGRRYRVEMQVLNVEGGSRPRSPRGNKEGHKEGEEKALRERLGRERRWE